MRYLLDTNVVIALLKCQAPITERVFGNKRRDYALSPVVAHELVFGAMRSRRPDEALAAYEDLRLHPRFNLGRCLEGRRNSGDAG